MHTHLHGSHVTMPRPGQSSDSTGSQSSGLQTHASRAPAPAICIDTSTAMQMTSVVAAIRVWLLRRRRCPSLTRISLVGWLWAVHHTSTATTHYAQSCVSCVLGSRVCVCTYVYFRVAHCCVSICTCRSHAVSSSSSTTQQ